MSFFGTCSLHPDLVLDLNPCSRVLYIWWPALGPCVQAALWSVRLASPRTGICKLLDRCPPAWCRCKGIARDDLHSHPVRLAGMWE